MNYINLFTLIAALNFTNPFFAQDAETLMKMGKKLESAKLERDAVLKYDMVIAMNEGDKYNLEALYYRGNYKRKKGHFDAAKSDYNSAIAICEKVTDEKPKLVSQVYYNRAVIKLKEERYQGAIRDLDKSIEYFPRNAEFYARRGMAKYNLKDKPGACEDFTEARLLDSNIIDEEYEEAYSKSLKKCK
jgi:tetratricopeptide (TPR) repeat protein